MLKKSLLAIALVSLSTTIMGMLPQNQAAQNLPAQDGTIDITNITGPIIHPPQVGIQDEEYQATYIIPQRAQGAQQQVYQLIARAGRGGYSLSPKMYTAYLTKPGTPNINIKHSQAVKIFYLLKDRYKNQQGQR